MMWIKTLFLVATTTSAFVVRPVTRQALRLKAAETEVEEQLDSIAHKLRLRVFDVDTGVYGLESKDPFYGIENIRTTLRLDENNSLGLTLTEVAHSDMDHRGLVMVSALNGFALETPIHVGDTIVGVFVGQDFRESTTGMDYDDTMDVLNRAKLASLDLGVPISLELNRVVKRAQVHVEVEEDHGKVTTINALAGDNLRLLLLHNHAKLYDGTTPRLDQPHLTSDCGGEGTKVYESHESTKQHSLLTPCSTFVQGICGTCLVAVHQGMAHLNKVGPQEQTILMHRPNNWRAACKTVVGADNEEGSVLRIRLHPQSVESEHLGFHP